VSRAGIEDTAALGKRIELRCVDAAVSPDPEPLEV
jgi:hypothetical protein